MSHALYTPPHALRPTPHTRTHTHALSSPQAHPPLALLTPLRRLAQVNSTLTLTLILTLTR